VGCRKTACLNCIYSRGKIADSPKVGLEAPRQIAFMRPTKLALHQPVAVTWEDSASTHAPWHKPQEVVDLEPLVIYSIGLVVGSTKRGLVIATGIDEGAAAVNALSIPWGCITVLTLLPSRFAAPAAFKRATRIFQGEKRK